MPNDIPDWTGQHLVQPISTNGQFLGDTGGPFLNPDQATDSITASQSPVALSSVLASFKAAAGSTIALRGVAGPQLTSLATSLQGQFGQATAAGNFLLAWVSCALGPPTTVAAGWVKAKDNAGVGGSSYAALWYKPNCGAAEAAPTFTGNQAGSVMTVQLAEFTGVATAAPVDQTASSNGPGTSITLTAPAADVAFGDLVAMVSRWQVSLPVTATFQESYNNGGAAVQVGNTGIQQIDRHVSDSYTIIPPAKVPLPFGVRPWDVDAQGLNNAATGSQSKVILAAVTGKTYRLTDVAGSISQTATTVANLGVQVLDGAALLWGLQVSVDGVAGHGASVVATGLARKGTAGNSMTAQINAAVAGINGEVTIGAYLQ